MLSLDLFWKTNPETPPRAGESTAAMKEREMRVGFIGLGQMGAGMALNLVKAGHEVTVYNRTPAKAADGSPTARCIAAISCC
ncbi:hypothetical protein FRZ44_01010 [Hypericibacter terrae]|uniref:6-phosphogluconate dehydrogenase NADP-binding domain-containing protein n=1 Tax=Hypericibacter terrae TaxID=2602015 RepID=A0A5J6MJE8_9PROT|nr:hypothetical protein FRZ44_01010 [Hypericibacter terrae]